MARGEGAIRGVRGHNDNSDPGAGPFTASTAAIFLPTTVVFVGYVAAFVVLLLAGKADGALARLCVAVILVAVPLLGFHALLRRLTIRIAILPRALQVHAGFPRLGAIEVPLGAIVRVLVLRGPVGRLTDAGSVVIETVDGGRITVNDIALPSEVVAAITRVMGGGRPFGVPADGSGDDLPAVSSGSGQKTVF